MAFIHLKFLNLMITLNLCDQDAAVITHEINKGLWDCACYYQNLGSSQKTVDTIEVRYSHAATQTSHVLFKPTFVACVLFTMATTVKRI